MTVFLEARATPFVRVDFSDNATWQSVLEKSSQPNEEGFVAHLEVVEDNALDMEEPLQIARRARENPIIALCIFADALTMKHPDHPLLCVDLSSFETIRVVPGAVQSIENNLSIRNMDLSDFANAADENGIFRGF